jgi:hypothetical protein
MSKMSSPPSSRPPRRSAVAVAERLRSITRQSRTVVAGVTAAGIVAAGAAVAGATVVAAPPSGLVAMGPASSSHGFPVWYEDSNGLRLEQCLDLEDQYCDPAFLAGEMPDATSPMSFPANWPMESFYFAADAGIDLPGGGKATLVSALEATFANEEVRDGDQVVFGRVRFDLDLPGAGTYTVTHPYGQDTFEVSAQEADGFRYVEDITPAPGNFALAMKSRISPFLTWDTGLVEANGNKYVGDPAVAHKVTGSPLGTNFFRIEGPDIGGPGVNVVETDLFNLMGKVSTNSGIDAHKAVLNESAAGTYLDVFAGADAGDTLTVEGEGFDKATLTADGRRYFARIPLDGVAPQSVTVTNASDVPVASKSVPVSDEVTISGAVYDTEAKTLTVNAASTDQLEPPALTLEGLVDAETGAPAEFTDGQAVLKLASPPSSVKVTSAGGGTGTAPVTVSGAGMSTPAATVAVVTGPANALLGAEVTLDASASLNTESVVWTQTAGPDVGVTGATTNTVTFTAPAEPAELGFTVTATGTGGEHTSAPFVLTVGETIPEPEQPAAPVAAAKASPADAAPGQTVTVSGADSTNAAAYAWTQLSGTAVDVPASGESFSFAMPQTTEPLVFGLTVTSPEGTSSEQTRVTVTPIADELTVSAAELRTRKNEWRIAGTAKLTNTNTVRVYLQKADGTKGALIGSSIVAAPVAPATTGDWTIRVRGIAPIAGAQPLLIVESTRGGRLDNVRYTTRR